MLHLDFSGGKVKLSAAEDFGLLTILNSSEKVDLCIAASSPLAIPVKESDTLFEAISKPSPQKRISLRSRHN